MAKHIHIHFAPRRAPVAVAARQTLDQAPGSVPQGDMEGLVNALMEIIHGNTQDGSFTQDLPTHDADFNEEDHPRDESGKWTAGAHTAAASQHESAAAASPNGSPSHAAHSAAAEAHTLAAQHMTAQTGWAEHHSAKAQQASQKANATEGPAQLEQLKAMASNPNAPVSARAQAAAQLEQMEKTANSVAASPHAVPPAPAGGAPLGPKPTSSSLKGIKNQTHELLSSGHPFALEELMKATGVTKPDMMKAYLNDLKSHKYTGGGRTALAIVKRPDGMYHVQPAAGGAAAPAPASVLSRVPNPNKGAGWKNPENAKPTVSGPSTGQRDPGAKFAGAMAANKGGSGSMESAAAKAKVAPPKSQEIPGGQQVTYGPEHLAALKSVLPAERHGRLGSSGTTNISHEQHAAMLKHLGAAPATPASRVAPHWPAPAAKPVKRDLVDLMNSSVDKYVRGETANNPWEKTHPGYAAAEKRKAAASAPADHPKQYEAGQVMMAKGTSGHAYKVLSHKPGGDVQLLSSKGTVHTLKPDALRNYAHPPGVGVPGPRSPKAPVFKDPSPEALAPPVKAKPKADFLRKHSGALSSTTHEIDPSLLKTHIKPEYAYTGPGPAIPAPKTSGRNPLNRPGGRGR